jgi:uncharacterized protein YktA (UPF0223 family)
MIESRKIIMQSFQTNPSAYFPIDYLLHLFEYLNKNKQYKIITYDDLCWQDHDDPEKLYPNEYNEWNKIKDKNKIHILFQHDVDSIPARTELLLKKQINLGIKSNVMIFNKRVNRSELKKNKKLTYTKYNLDKKLLLSCQENGFIIGYHMNAIEQSLYDLKIANKIFNIDISELRRVFNIKYFSAHGGVAGKNNINNHSMEYKYNKNLIWVHNKISARFDKTFSDGGINNTNKWVNPSSRSLINFLNDMKPGRRYRILLHPQYYDKKVRANKLLKNHDWYKNIVNYDYTKKNFFETYSKPYSRLNTFKKIFRNIFKL